MTTHTATIEVTDEELGYLSEIGYPHGESESKHVYPGAKVLQRVVNNTSAPKRYTQLGDELDGGAEVVYVSSQYVVARWENGAETAYPRTTHSKGSFLYMDEGYGVMDPNISKNYPLAYFPEA